MAYMKHDAYSGAMSVEMSQAVQYRSWVGTVERRGTFTSSAVRYVI